MKTTNVLAAALVASLAALTCGAAQASCYIVRDAKGKVISESPNPPVDMSRQLHETVPVKYGAGATMNFSIAEANCGKEIDPLNDDTVAPQAAKPAKAKKRTRRAARKKAQPAADS